MVDEPSLSRATLASILGVAVERLPEAPLAGRVHDHWRLQPKPGGPALMVRIPKLSHLGLSPRAALIYEAQAFRRGEPSGSTPRLHGLLRVGRRLPWGGLVVDAIDGRPPHLPDDLPALGRALAGVHGLPVPVPARRRPLLDPMDPVGYLLQVARGQLDPIRDTLTASVRRLLETEMAAAAATADQSRPAPRLTLADTHPGNFRIRLDGTAVMLDVERPVYDSPAVDLAHASLPTSLNWDPAVTGTAQRSDIIGFHNAWTTAMPRPVVDTVRPHILAYRRLIWLRTTTWACAWAARTDVAAALASSKPDVADQARRLARFADPAMMEAAREQWSGPKAFTAEELVP
ncbi:aminoglycoside phosphotransferase [alpha proteobacterium BAL199]|jgi:hypothetical protein|nr:aminoglycoside phosphotransferase [alpha proteobacterium BAL199]